MKASVIICTYNRAKLLENSIYSVQGQDLVNKEFEIVVVDNNSTDETRAVVEKMVNASPVMIKYVFEKHQGLSIARNTGISNASGEIIVFTDDDIEAEKSWLRELISVFDDTEVFAAGGPIRPIWLIEKPAWLTEKWYSYLTINEFESAREKGEFNGDNECPWGANMAFRREVFDLIGMFPTDLGRVDKLLLSNEEVHLFKKIKESGKRIKFAIGAIVYHKITPEKLKKLWFYHRTYWQGRSDAIIDASNNTYTYKRLRELSTAPIWRAIESNQDFERRCLSQYTKGYFHQIILSQREYGGMNNFKILRALETFQAGIIQTSTQLINEKERKIKELSQYIDERHEEIKRLQEYIDIIRNTLAFKVYNKSIRLLNKVDEILKCGLLKKQRYRKYRKQILVISPCLPRFDRASGWLRLYRIVEILQRCYDVTFVADDFLKSQECDDSQYEKILRDLGIAVYHQGNELIEIFKKRFDVIIFEFFYTALNHLSIIKDYNPDVPIIIDTVDVHFAREVQMAEVHKDVKMYERAIENKKEELDAYHRADLVWTVTERDKDILLQEDSSLKVDVIPNIHKMDGEERRVNRIERNTMLFVGGFLHQPNEDGVLYFCKEIYPLIKEKVQNARAWIVGDAPTPAVKALVSDSVEVIGYVTDIKYYLERSHVSIAPLRYGAGMKGKVGEAMAEGIPVVTTCVGIQGMDVINGKHLIVADTPEEFAKGVLRLFEDEILYDRIARSAKEYMRERYTPEIVEKKLVSSIGGIFSKY